MRLFMPVMRGLITTGAGHSEGAEVGFPEPCSSACCRAQAKELTIGAPPLTKVLSGQAATRVAERSPGETAQVPGTAQEGLAAGSCYCDSSALKCGLKAKLLLKY